MALDTPTSLSFVHKYKQAKQIIKHTSRATNPNWYADALAIHLQLHIFVGSDSGAISYIRNTETGAWAKGPNITTEMEEDTSLLEPILEGIQSEYLAEAKNPGLGVILYVADDFSTAELGPEHQNPAELEELRRLIKEDPKSILEDHSISNTSHSWRLFPYPGAASGQPFATAIAFTRRHENLLKQFRDYGNEHNWPIRTRAISAPLCAISALPWLLEQKPENGFVACYHYPRFSVLGFFNIHGDLVLIRTLQHHGNIPYSPQTASAIMTTIASLELEKPHLFIIPMAGATPEGMSDSLSHAIPHSQVITLSPTSSALHIPTAPSAANPVELGVTRPWKWSDLTAQASIKSEPTEEDAPESDTAIPGVTRPWKMQDMEAVAMLSQVRLEVVATTNPPSASNSVLAENHTFKSLVEEMWPIQDFLPSSQDEATLHPTQIEMKLLHWSKTLQLIAAAILLGFIATSIFHVAKAKNSPAWAYETQNPLIHIHKNKQELKKFNLINNLLNDRSRSWVNMELLALLFPNQEVLISKFDYTFDMMSNNITKGSNVPIKRTWVITGKTTNEGRNYLDSLNSTKGILKVFKKVYTATGDQSFDLSLKDRDPPFTMLKAKNDTNRNLSNRKHSSNLSHSFVFTITQKFEGKDAMTLPKQKPIKKRKRK